MLILCGPLNCGGMFVQRVFCEEAHGIVYRLGFAVKQSLGGLAIYGRPMTLRPDFAVGLP